MRFDGMRVIVTGGARGIGRGIVDAFLDEGARVLATDMPGDALTSLGASTRTADRLGVHAADLEDVDAVGRSCPPPSRRWAASTSSSTTPACSPTARSSICDRPTSTGASR